MPDPATFIGNKEETLNEFQKVFDTLKDLFLNNLEKMKK